MRSKQELQKENFLPTVGFEPTAFRSAFQRTTYYATGNLFDYF